MLFGLGMNFSSFMNSHAQRTDATRYTTIPVNTCPRRDIGIMISLRTGCTTKSDDDITPVHIHGFNAHSGRSLNVDTAPMTMNAGTHSHEWKLKLPQNTTAADTTARAA